MGEREIMEMEWMEIREIGVFEVMRWEILRERLMVGREEGVIMEIRRFVIG